MANKELPAHLKALVNVGGQPAPGPGAKASARGLPARRSLESRPYTASAGRLVLPLWNDLLACLRFAPFAVGALAIYAALTSSALFEGSFFFTSRDYLHNPRLNLPWIPTYFNKFDLLLFGAIALTWITRPLRLDRRATVLLLLVLLFILLSLAGDIYNAQFPAVRDALVNWARFAAVFTIILALQEHLGTRAIENLLVVLFLILCLSSLFVYSEIFSTSHRIYAAGMTVASSSQIAAVVALLAIVRKRYFLLTLSLIYLFLTFSLTSIGLLLALSLFFAVVSTDISARQRLVSILVIIFVIATGIYLTSNVGQFEIEYNSIYSKLPGVANQFTFHGRSDIWTYGFQQITSGSVGFFGIGFGKTAGMLNSIMFGSSFSSLEVAPHFHSIILESFIGLGIPSLFIFFLMVRRTWQTWLGRCQPAALIFAFLFLSQSFDFTLYHPKEVILWAFMLAVAEGQWRLYQATRARDQESPAVTHPTSLEPAMTAAQPATVRGGG